MCWMQVVPQLRTETLLCQGNLHVYVTNVFTRFVHESTDNKESYMPTHLTRMRKLRKYN